MQLRCAVVKSRHPRTRTRRIWPDAVSSSAAMERGYKSRVLLLPGSPLLRRHGSDERATFASARPTGRQATSQPRGCRRRRRRMCPPWMRRAWAWTLMVRSSTPTTVLPRLPTQEERSVDHINEEDIDISLEGLPNTSKAICSDQSTLSESGY